MNPIIRNVLAIIAGIAIGSFVNMGIITISGSIIPPPEGVDMTTIEGMEAAMPLLQSKHYIMPFLAHGLGTLVGALIAALIATTSKMKFAIGIGGFFMLGGIAAANMIPAPTWFITVDLALAYFPMAWIGGKIAGSKSK